MNKLSAEIPARFIAFDILVWKGTEAWQEPLGSGGLARAEREALRALPRDAGSRGGARLARALRGDRPRRRRSPSGATSRISGLARRRRQGEAGANGRLRRRRRPLEVEARPDRDAAPGPLPRRRRDGLRRLGSGRTGAARRDRGAHAAAARERSRATVLRAEPLGRRRAGGVAAAARSSSSRCATTRCSRTGSGTGRSSSASATTRTPSSAHGASSGRRYGRRTRWRRYSRS